jgi:FlgD Ig-like domain/Fibronectin type III domain
MPRICSYPIGYKNRSDIFRQFGKGRLLSLLTVVIMLLAGLDAVADQLTQPKLVATSDADGPTLGIPRWKGYMSELDPNNFWLSYASAGTTDGSLNFTTDAGESWSTNVMQIDVNGWLDFHLSLFGRNGELYFTMPGCSFRKFNAPAQSNADRGPLVALAGTGASHRSNIMVQNTGRIWIFTRASANAAENVKYQYSDNQGGSWTMGTAYATGAPDVRIGSMPYVGGNPALVVEHLNDNRGFEYYLWNGTSFVAKNDHSMYAANMQSTRVFTHNVINDTTMHLIFGQENSLHHVWKNYNNGSGTWNHEIIDNSATTVDNDWYPISTVKGNDLYLFYCRKSTTNASSSMIYYKKWSQVSQSWTAPVLVSTLPENTSNRDPNTCFHVPSNANYIPVFWWSAGTPNRIYFAKILTGPSSGDTIPPGKILDLGAATGRGQGEATLSWTSPGNDAYSGTADHYSIRYSTVALNEANWLAATAVTSPPFPQQAGRTEQLVVDGLTTGATYYFGIKTYDEAGNASPISNLAIINIVLDVADDGLPLPRRNRLLGNHPNPFNSTTVIDYQISSRAHVKVSVYDLLGQRVSTLVDAVKAVGNYSASWDGTNSRGESVASGIYFCRMDVNDSSELQKMLLLK